MKAWTLSALCDAHRQSHHGETFLRERLDIPAPVSELRTMALDTAMAGVPLYDVAESLALAVKNAPTDAAHRRAVFALSAIVELLAIEDGDTDDDN